MVCSRRYVTQNETTVLGGFRDVAIARNFIVDANLSRSHRSTLSVQNLSSNRAAIRRSHHDRTRP